MASSSETAAKERPVEADQRPAAPRQGFLRRFDIAAKLFVAFSAVAGLTVLAALVAWVLFNEVRRNLTLIADDSLPEIVNSFRLAQESVQLSATITNLARAETQDELDQGHAAVTARLQAIDELVHVHAVHEGETDASIVDFERTIADTRAILEQLRGDVARQITATGRQEQLMSALLQDHREFLEAVDPMIDATRDEMIESSRRSVAEGTAGISSLIDDSFDSLRAVMLVEANIYLLTSAIYRAAASDQPSEVWDLRYAIVAPIAEIRGAFSQMSDLEQGEELKILSGAIIDTAIGGRGVFPLKLATLEPASQDATRNGSQGVSGGTAPSPTQLSRRLSRRLTALSELVEVFKTVNGQAIAVVDEAILAAATDMSREGQKIVDKTRQGIDRFETVLLLKSAVNQLFGLLSQAATALSRNGNASLKARYLELESEVEDLLRTLDAIPASQAVRPVISQILAHGVEGRSIFAVRDQVLDAQAKKAVLLREGHRLAGALSGSAQYFVDKAEAAASEASGVTLSDLSRGEALLLAIAASSLLAVVLIAWLFVLRGIVRRMQALSATMLSIADGHLEVAIPLTKSDDEITDMGRALAVFRENAVKRREAERSLRVAKERAETALQELKAAQRRLVQAEKMASLGQLTAGIAHEIKNPLNFVNNFAQLSRELIEELRAPLQQAKERVDAKDREEIEDIFGDLDLNLDKIAEHGKRADSIVRGMLEHSRESSQVVEATDLNKLLEEYVNLAYHGMRAQHSDFNVTIERDLADGLPPVEAVTQDIGRVFLNIVSNAFQAIYQKSQEKRTAYDPKLFLSTRREGDSVEVRIGDNGPGMSDELLGKIFQPFFTTKPTGEGTGLGLSISYDIVVQQHGGRLEASAREGEGSAFLVALPIGAKEAGERPLQEERS